MTTEQKLIIGPSGPKEKENMSEKKFDKFITKTSNNKIWSPQSEPKDKEKTITSEPIQSKEKDKTGSNKEINVVPSEPTQEQEKTIFKNDNKVVIETQNENPKNGENQTISAEGYDFEDSKRINEIEGKENIQQVSPQHKDNVAKQTMNSKENPFESIKNNIDINNDGIENEMENDNKDVLP